MSRASDAVHLLKSAVGRRPIRPDDRLRVIGVRIGFVVAAVGLVFMITGAAASVL